MDVSFVELRHKQLAAELAAKSAGELAALLAADPSGWQFARLIDPRRPSQNALMRIAMVDRRRLIGVRKRKEKLARLNVSSPITDIKPKNE